MSHFTGPQNTFWAGLWAPDERIRLAQDRWWEASRSQAQPWADGLLWPQSRFMCGDPAADSWPVGNCNTDIARYEHWSTTNNNDEAGNQVRSKIRGFTRDNTGAVLGSVRVMGFLTASNTFVSECYSDGGGYYELCSQYPATNHFVVMYKAGAPDTTGASANTLQPS